MGAYPHPHGAQIRQKMAKNGQKWSKNGQKAAKIETESGRDGVVPPPPPGVQKKRNPGHFPQGKKISWANIFRGSGPPYPHGVQNWPSIPPVVVSNFCNLAPHVNLKAGGMQYRMLRKIS